MKHDYRIRIRMYFLRIKLFTCWRMSDMSGCLCFWPVHVVVCFSKWCATTGAHAATENLQVDSSLVDWGSKRTEKKERAITQKRWKKLVVRWCNANTWPLFCSVIHSPEVPKKLDETHGGRHSTAIPNFALQIEILENHHPNTLPSLKQPLFSPLKICNLEGSTAGSRGRRYEQPCQSLRSFLLDTPGWCFSNVWWQGNFHAMDIWWFLDIQKSVIKKRRFQNNGFCFFNVSKPPEKNGKNGEG